LAGAQTLFSLQVFRQETLLYNQCMTILVSACLLGRNCKYNGGNNRNEKVLRFVKDKKVIAVCPEQLGGLPTPRSPAEIVCDKVKTNVGTDVDASFREGADKALRLIEGMHVDLAILQPRSPSCGTKEIYDGSFSGRLIPGMGVFAEALCKKGIKVIEPDDLDSLSCSNSYCFCR